MVIFKTLFKTLNDGASSFTITDETISDNSIFEVYPSDDSVILADVTVNGTTANITFDSAAEYNIPCAVFINNLVGAYEPITHIDASNVNYMLNISVKDALDNNLEGLVNQGSRIAVLENNLPSDADIGDVLYHATSGNEWRKLTGSNVNYDDNTTINEKLDEVFTSVSNGKSIIADAITDKGIETSATDTFQTMADHIAEIESGGTGGGQTYYKFYDPVGGTKIDSFTSTMNGTLKLIAVGYMNDFATVKINGNLIPPTESYFIRADYYYYVYVETSVNTDDIIEVSGTATGTSSFAILASIVGDGMDIADTTATAPDVLSGKIFYSANGTRTIGTYEAQPSQNMIEGNITLTSSDQTINCGFNPDKIIVLVNNGVKSYFGMAIYSSGTSTGCRTATSSSSAESPATITLIENGFKIKSVASSFNKPCYYIAIKN